MTKIDEKMKKFSADKSELGFEYQFYFFLWKLLEMKKGDIVSWEVKDDVSLELSNGITYLFQLKHTTENKADGNPINLTKFDTDLWKTLANWCDIIISNEDINKQKNFIEKHFFVLATNKSQSNNSFLDKINSYKGGVYSFLDLKSSIEYLLSETKNTILKDYISKVLKIDDELLQLFFRQLQFQLEEIDLIQNCKDAIEEKMIPCNKLDNVFDSLYSNIRNDNYITIKKGDKVSISFEDFHKKYRRCFEQCRSGNLVVIRPTPIMPDKVQEQTFIKQLVDIGDIESDDLITQMEYTKFKILLERNFDEWYQNGDITGLERDEYFTDGINQWKNEFHSKYRGLVDSSLYNEKGNQIIYELRKKNLFIKNQQLSTDLSNGTFYHLADIPEIGFRKDWEEKYAK